MTTPASMNQHHQQPLKWLIQYKYWLLVYLHIFCILNSHQAQIPARTDWVAPTPLTKSWGWSWLQEAVCLGHGGKLSLKSLTLGPFCLKIDKKAFSFWPPPGVLPLDPHYMLVLVLVTVRPLANPGSAPNSYNGFPWKSLNKKQSRSVQ